MVAPINMLAPGRSPRKIMATTRAKTSRVLRKGATTEITTTEVIDGKAQKVKAKFRAYSSYEESFKDYAKLMQDSPRYQGVMANAKSAEGFAQGLQRAGYATDPQYANKLSKVINTTLRLQRALT